MIRKTDLPVNFIHLSKHVLLIFVAVISTTASASPVSLCESILKASASLLAPAVQEASQNAILRRAMNANVILPDMDLRLPIEIWSGRRPVGQNGRLTARASHATFKGSQSIQQFLESHSAAALRERGMQNTFTNFLTGVSWAGLPYGGLMWTDSLNPTTGVVAFVATLALAIRPMVKIAYDQQANREVRFLLDADNSTLPVVVLKHRHGTAILHLILTREHSGEPILDIIFSEETFESSSSSSDSGYVYSDGTRTSVDGGSGGGGDSGDGGGGGGD